MVMMGFVLFVKSFFFTFSFYSDTSLSVILSS